MSEIGNPRLAGAGSSDQRVASARLRIQQTTNLQYQFSQKDLRGLWLGLTWRFDSGLVVVSVPDYATALTLTGDEQQAMGLYCGSVFVTVQQRLQSCNSRQRGATLVHIVPDGTYDPGRGRDGRLGHTLCQR